MQINTINTNSTDDFGFVESMVNTIPTPISFIDTSYHYRFINDAYCTYFNKEKDKIIGHTVDELFEKDVFSEVIKPKLERCFQGETIDYKHWMTFSDNSRRYLNIQYIPYKNHEGKVIGAFVHVNDISDVKKSHEDLRFHVEKAEKYLDLAGTMIISLDTQGNITLLNKKGYEILGYDDGELIGRNWFDTCLPSDMVDEVKDVFQRIVRGDIESVEYYENPVVRKNGEHRLISWHNTILKDDNGAITGLLSSGDDITDKHEMEQKLHRIFDMASELICEADINTATFTKVNPAFTRVLGYSEEELLSHSFIEFIHPDDRESTQKVIDEQLQRGEKVLTFINRYRCKDGSYVWLDWNSHPVPEEGFTYAVARDITEKKKAEEKIKKISKENQFQANIVKNAPVIAAFHDCDNNIIWANKEYEKATGRTLEEIKGKKCYSVWGLSEPCNGCPVLKCIKTRKNEEYELTPENQKHWPKTQGSWLSKAVPVFDENKKIIGAIETAVDLTEKKQAEDKVRQSKKETERILNIAGDGIRIVTKDLKIKTVNDTFAEMVGLSKDEIIGKNCSDVFKSADCGTENCPMKKVLRTGESFEVETIRRTLDDREIQCILKVTPYRNEHDEIIGVIEDFRDITKLKQSQARFRNIFENKGTATGIFRDDSIIIQCNSKFVEQSGYSRDEIIGKMHWYDFVHKGDIDEMMRFHQQRSAGGNPPGLYECRMVTKNGEIRTMVVNIGVIPDSKERIVSLVDITNQKNVETNLRNTQEELKRLNNNLEREVEDRTQKIKKLLVQKDEFINQLGHDLKNPLGPLVNLLPILEKNETDPKQKEMIQVMNRNVAYIRNLVAKTIQLAQLKSPSSGLNYETIDLGQQVDEILRNNQLHLEEKYIVADNRIPAGVMVDADRLKLQEVFNNLLNNAVKYNKEDGGNIIIDQTLDGDNIMVSVKDFGVGMTEEQLGKVFDEFYKADTSRHDFESSGLGMAITKRIVEKHGGRIWAESDGIGKGSTFFFTLPLRNKDQN